ncbi:rRNA-processing protein bfr2 [Coemansia javaensis]|uniref:Protein BFR2 n=1 Tax=Coemansia javaensis TaxID=2761396 RepID=A0A9W8LLC5_9FUNG|nr:rRNA-processing protein bfr2 [Coemansia javaensis]
MPKGAKHKKSLLEQIADISDPRPKDFDIENAGVHDNAYLGQQSGSDDDDEGSDDEDLKRKHYLDVGKSALRAHQGIGDLGPEYAGSRVSRKDLYGDDDSSLDDGSAVAEDESSMDEDDEAEDGDDSDEDDDGSDEQDGPAMDDASDSDSDSDSGSDAAGSEMADVQGGQRTGGSGDRVREEIRRLEEGEKALLSSITQTARSDVEKGKHVLNQTRMWEGALDARIRVQKMVAAANELPQPDAFGTLVEERYAGSGPEEAGGNRLERARQSVRGLLGSLAALRRALIAQNPAASKAQDAAEPAAGAKRKAAPDANGIEAAWEEVDGLSRGFRPFRDESLERWGNKVQVTAGAASLKKFKAVNQGVMHQIGQALASSERLIERTQLKRVDYKIIGKDDGAEDASGDEAMVDAHLKKTDPEIFDDTDFYQQLLRELIESRMVDSNDPMGSLGVRWAAVSQRSGAKRRTVDTKASKGRRIRYHVMEKLQNFMPPIPAGSWHEDMVNELFSTLLGQRVPQSILDADVEQDQDQAAGGASAQPAQPAAAASHGLRLFG